VKPSIAIHEYDAKLLLAYWLERAPPVDSSAKITTNFTFPSPKVAQISWDLETNTITPDTRLPGWVFSSKLVAKPDQLIKRRGKAGLLALNQTWDEAKEWMGKAGEAGAAYKKGADKGKGAEANQEEEEEVPVKKGKGTKEVKKSKSKTEGEGKKAKSKPEAEEKAPKKKPTKK